MNMVSEGEHSRRVQPRKWRLTAWLLVISLWTVCVHPAEVDVRRDAAVEAVERVMPSVVNIQTETIVEYSDPFDELLREFWGPYYRRRPPNTEYSLGSGVIIHEEGYVLTNLHVVRRANRITVKVFDGNQFKDYEAEPIVGTTRSDVALLKLKTKPGERFRAVKFTRDDDLLLGETVLALGNPFGLGGSVSRGILSSKNRRLPKEDEPLDVADWLQTDAAINPGNSGGPLINLRGELIGLNVAVYREGQGIGFAIPIKQVTEALSEIFIPEVIHSLWFGARIKAGPYPPTVTFVKPNSPAGQAGLRVGDQILQVDGKTPKGFIECNEMLNVSTKPTTLLVAQKNGDHRKLTIQLLPLSRLVKDKLGLDVQELTPELVQALGVKGKVGLLIADVEKGGPTEQTKLQSGFLITGIEGQTTTYLMTAADILADKKKGERVRLTVLVPQRAGNLVGYRQGTVDVKVR
ncbi:MAG: trypsin-like peptidase domain-containing protein [Verrucomicrobia bacterium]|nr:trypsin-like peptidase domain-containing protein [Verrucomicrobiota bacterium]